MRYNVKRKKNTYEYDPWGSITTQTETIDNSIKYAGEYFDDETGLIYLRNRYYDPSVGRFISEDPIRDGANWYVYANNNPVNYVDPTGLDAIVITDDEAAGNFGHTSAIYQDADGNWFYTYWGNKAAAVIRIPDTYVKEYRRNGDISGNSMDSLADFNKSLNRFLSNNGFTDITSNYDQATYIVGDFTASLQAAYDDVNWLQLTSTAKAICVLLMMAVKCFKVIIVHIMLHIEIVWTKHMLR